MYKTTITCSTPCFESFIKEFELSPNDYDVIRSPIHNVRVVPTILTQTIELLQKLRGLSVMKFMIILLMNIYILRRNYEEAKSKC